MIQNLARSKFFNNEARAYVLSATVRDPNTELLVNINILGEESAAGFFQLSSVEVIPFWRSYPQLTDGEENMLVAWRIILLVWNLGLVLARLSKNSTIKDMVSSSTIIAIAAPVAIFIMQCTVMSMQLEAKNMYDELELPPVNPAINLLDYGSKMRQLATSYYYEVFIDSLSIFFQWVNITLLFQNVRVFAYFWNTLKSMYGLVNLSVAYFVILASGLTTASISLSAGYDARYLSFVMAFSVTLIPFGSSKIEPEMVHYAPLTYDRCFLSAMYDLTSVWLLLIMFSGLFLPMFSREF
mmetsp:Transcript_14181/g.19275  ORF Transcript_14181/g.19275 Transcript_14181/m.19275 type:complete len:297 (+) Transcript_14181:466-1356(+)